jgi:protoporphyrinogen oxidase
MKQKLTIIGGGITGLASAYIASKNGWDVTVLESSPQMGGLMSTFSIGGTRLEHYYHHFFTHDVELLWLCKELELEDKLFFHKTTMGVFSKGKIYNFNTPIDLLKFNPLSFFDKLRFGLTSLYLANIADWRKMENISALDWLYKYAGKGTTNSLWKPLINVKFGPYANGVPISWMIGRLAQRMNSRKDTTERLGYLQGSSQILLKRLLKILKNRNVKLVTNVRVVNLTVRNNILTSVKTSRGEFSKGKFLFTMPSCYLSPLLKKIDLNYAKEIENIKYFGAVCVVLEMKKKLSDIYWLNIADEGYPFGGVIEHTNFISSKHYHGSHIAYLSRYFAASDPIAKMSGAQVQQHMLSSLKKVFPNFDNKNVKNTHVFKTNTAAVVCSKNFSKKVPECRTPIENMFLATMAHIYPDERSCNNSIRIAAEACRVIGIRSDFVPKNSSLSGKIAM